MKNKLLLTIIVAILITIILIVAFENYANFNNGQLDNSCKIDSDCAIKVAGIYCDRLYESCMNKNSTEYTKSFTQTIEENLPGAVSCMGIKSQPTSCTCQNSICENQIKID